jgi:hypothetical protein
MVLLSRHINTLRQRVEDENLKRCSIIWRIIIYLTFHNFDETELRNITCGVFQLRLSSSLMQEYLEGNSEIFVHQEDDHLIRVRLHIIQDIFVMDRVQPAWYCKYRAHLVVPWICKTQTAYVLLCGVRNWGEHLEDASHVIDDTDICLCNQCLSLLRLSV